METFIYGDMKRASLNKDITKVKTLGPFATAIKLVIDGSRKKNIENDIINSINNGTPTFLDKDYSKPKVIIINKIYTLLFTKFTFI